MPYKNPSLVIQTKGIYLQRNCVANGSHSAGGVVDKINLMSDGLRLKRTVIATDTPGQPSKWLGVFSSHHVLSDHKGG
jgi:hypothetical protein